MDPYARQREQMVIRQIASRGVTDPRVLKAMETVPRHLFVPLKSRRFAYDDYPLAIGCDQTISQPYIVAFMTEQLRIRDGDTVLEIGTGSGYQAAVLAEIAARVITTEVRPELAETAARTLADLGYTNIDVLCANGFERCPALSEYARIITTAAPPEIPGVLVESLAPSGRLIIPVGHPWAVQTLVAVNKNPDGGVTTEELLSVRFVPMIQKESHP
jgi:protein-L-isoaspartate(D-aspartate) O-methyltransferase